jgi:hypothetical protein
MKKHLTIRSLAVALLVVLFSLGASPRRSSTFKCSTASAPKGS